MTTPDSARASRRRLAAALSMLCALVAGPANAGPFSGLFVFGDSVSDAGNVAAATAQRSPPPSDNSFIPDYPYATGTFSNGPVWVSSFASELGLAALPSLLGGTDFAFGGARVAGSDSPVPSLTGQLQSFLSATQGVAPGGALYVVAGVGNDARDTLQAIAQGADAALTMASASHSYSSGLGSLVDALQAAGAQHILVMNTVDLGLVPSVRALDQARPGTAAVATLVSRSFDAALAGRLDGEAGVTLFDSFAFLSGLVGGAEFANVTDACGALGAQADCSGYLFWDGIHPTAAGHRALATAVYAAAVPEPATWALLGCGLVVLALAGRGRRQHPRPEAARS